MIEQILLFVASLVANTMSAFAGGGAGLVQLPAILLLGLPFPIALATHKVATVALGIGATYRFSKEKNIFNYKLAILVSIAGMLGSICGAHIIIGVDEVLAKHLLAAITISLGVYAAFKKELGQEHNPQNETFKGFFITTLIVLLIGVFNGTLTSGSGLFLTVWLILWHGLDYKRAVAYTLTLNGVLWNASGAITLTALGEPVHWPWIPTLLIASFGGGYIGAHLNTLKGNKVVKVAFTVVTILSGLSLLVK